MCDSKTIFISIACFLDNDVLNTITDALTKAKFPDNLRFGICFQYDPNDDFLSIYDNHPQFRIHRMPYSQAKGPIYARYFCSKMIKDEDFYLQIDCHTRFFENWDVMALEIWGECNDEKAILSCFPVPIRCMNTWQSYGMNCSTPTFNELSLKSIKLDKTRVKYQPNLQNKPNYYLSGAFIFGPSRFLVEVPYDPNLIHSYQKVEQQFYAIRLYTSGWNIYMPRRHLVATLYGKTVHLLASGKEVTVPYSSLAEQVSWERVLHYYGIKTLPNITPEYGLGNARSLNSFFHLHREDLAIEKLKLNRIWKTPEWKLPISQTSSPSQPQSSQPHIKSSQHQIQSSQPQIQSSQPQIQSSQPQIQSSQPQIQSSQPLSKSLLLSAKSSQPQIQSSQPLSKSLLLSAKSSQPLVNKLVLPDKPKPRPLLNLKPAIVFVQPPHNQTKSIDIFVKARQPIAKQLQIKHKHHIVTSIAKPNQKTLPTIDGILTSPNLFSLHLRTFVINLERDSSKMTKMKSRLDQFNLSYERFNAINGRSLDLEKMLTDNIISNKIYNLRGHQVGCWQSHLTIWNQIIRDQTPLSLILEDDCRFVRDFPEQLAKICQQYQSSCHAIYLGHSTCQIDGAQPLYLTKNGCPRRTHAYLVSLSGAKFLANHLSTLNYPVDEIMGKMFYTKQMNAYRTSYLLAYQPDQISANIENVLQD